MNVDYFQSVIVNSTAEKAFNALTKEIEKWWGSVDNAVNGPGDIFTITFGEYSWTFKIIEYNPNQALIWECIDGSKELNKEWIGHTLKWSIHERDQATAIDFDQTGLNASLPCYDVCSNAWDRYILSSLKDYLETGKGNPES